MSFVEKAKDRSHGQVPASKLGAMVQPAKSRGFESAQDVTRPKPIVIVNRPALRAAGLLPPEEHERRIADQYRRIKRPLIANATGRGTKAVENGHAIMIASALPAEGKTFTTVNLALSMARERDIEVLLVDADVAKPHVSATFGVLERRGFQDALVDDSVDPETLVLPSDVPRLSLMPAGTRTDNATEMIASARMSQIVAWIASGKPNRIAIFDSSPLLLTSESHVLSAVVGQVVLVVRAGFTPRQAVLDAIAHLGTRNIGLVLNQSEFDPQGGYYGYYGYGAYGDGGGTRPPP